MDLIQLEQQFKQDTSLPLASGNNPVFGEGSPTAPILAIGEAPGFHENRLGRPFVGRSGQLLRKLLVSVGLDLQQDIYITNIVKHRPPENRDPTPQEIAAYRPYLDKQIAIIKPKIIITLGRFSMHKFLPHAKISQIHGTAHFLDLNYGRVLLMPMYHPAAALRSSRVMQFFKEDFLKLKKSLDYYRTIGELALPPLSPQDFSKTNNLLTPTSKKHHQPSLL